MTRRTPEDTTSTLDKKERKFGPRKRAAAALALAGSMALTACGGEDEGKLVAGPTHGVEQPGANPSPEVTATIYTPEANTVITELSEEQYATYTLTPENYEIPTEITSIGEQTSARVQEQMTIEFSTNDVYDSSEMNRMKDETIANLETVFNSPMSVNDFGSIDEMLDIALPAYSDEYVELAKMGGMDREQININLQGNGVKSYAFNRLLKDAYVDPMAEALGVSDGEYSVNFNGPSVPEASNYRHDVLRYVADTKIAQEMMGETPAENSSITIVESGDFIAGNTPTDAGAPQFNYTLEHSLAGGVTTTFNTQLILSAEEPGTARLSTMHTDKPN